MLAIVEDEETPSLENAPQKYIAKKISSIPVSLPPLPMLIPLSHTSKSCVIFAAMGTKDHSIAWFE